MHIEGKQIPEQQKHAGKMGGEVSSLDWNADVQLMGLVYPESLFLLCPDCMASYNPSTITASYICLCMVIFFKEKKIENFFHNS